MKIELIAPWHSSYRHDDGYLPYDAVVDGDKEILILVNDQHQMLYSHLVPEHGTTLEYLPVKKEDAVAAWREYENKQKRGK